MSTANEILLMRADMMPKLESLSKRLEGELMPALWGMQLHVMPDHMKDLMTIQKWKVEKLPCKKRRKSYRVVGYRVPCAFVINQDMLRFPQFNGRIDG